MKSTRLPTFFVSHGGGPWPWMKDQTGARYDRLEASLQAVPALAGLRPTAVLMLSAHWEAPAFTVMSHPAPPMIYDYSGFPEHTYQIRYPAPGAPALASRTAELLRDAGLSVAVDPDRGFDHGLYSAMAPMYAQADMPVMQLSLRDGLDPAEHLALGRALEPLRDEGVLIIGSGLSYHNLRQMGAAGQQPSAAFDAWLQRTLIDSGPARRTQQLIAWAQAPSARAAHPREEHLLPLMVAVGAAASEAARCIYHEDAFAGALSVSSFMFGETATDNH